MEHRALLHVPEFYNSIATVLSDCNKLEEDPALPKRAVESKSILESCIQASTKDINLQDNDNKLR